MGKPQSPDAWWSRHQDAAPRESVRVAVVLAIMLTIIGGLGVALVANA